MQAISFLFLFASLFTPRAFSQPEPPCKEGPTQLGKAGVADIQWAMITTSTRGCMVKISDTSSKTSNRRYTFTEGGLIEVFNQYGTGPSSVSTGARSFFIFPRHQRPTATILKPGQNVSVVTSAGDVVYFTTENKLEIGDDESRTFHISQSDSVSPSNRGGAELILSGDAKRLILDCGFGIGGPTFNDTKHQLSSTFKDSDGHHCTLPNSVLFVKNPQTHDSEFRFGQDADLYAYLRKVPDCKGLVFPPESLSSKRVLRATGPGKAIQATDWDAAAKDSSGPRAH
jgi:hypothetical protein